MALTEEDITELTNRLSIEVDTHNPPYSGTIYLKVTLKLDGEEISSSQTTLPDISQLKRAEYSDW
jgi:hypothetical protein